jgi:predicted DsbA family dithiol-disulfide isomerase
MDDGMNQGEVCGPDGCAVPENASASPMPLGREPAAVTRVDVISDAICPWCWVGKANLDRALAILAEDGEAFDVHWRPFQLNPEMPREGVVRASYRAAKFGSAERSAAADARVAQAGAVAGLEFRHDLMLRTPNTVDAHRVVHLAGALGLQHEVVERLFRAYFQEGVDVGDRAELARLAGEAGMDAEEVSEFLASDALEAEVVAEDAQFRAGGLSGVPTFALAGHVLFSGAMPAEDIAEAFQKGLRILRERGVVPARAA